MEQFEQLLTCCVCLDRYRIPKLLPCQHSFCMEPCMEGLVDYVRRQVKCPECRAEHRIPYNGVQAFPTNVTLQRFLELHIEITGELPDPTSGQIMERCGVCSEKAYLSHCAHCEKKICEDCKNAHMDILRREITRFNSQIRRSMHRLQDSLALIEKNTISLQTNCVSVSEEIEEICRRITKAIRDRSDTLKGEIDRYLSLESRNLNTLKENLDLEIKNIASNCDLVDKFMNDSVEWDDCELMDTKEIFLKTVEFLRHFEYENSDYSRRVRFMVSIDPNTLVMNLTTFGDLNIAPHSAPGGGSVSSSHLAPPSSLQPGLMRSKSDHRLASQFRQQEERSGYNDEPVLGGRRFGERPQRSNTDRYGADSGSSRYGRGGDYDAYDNEYDGDQSSRPPGKSRFRSRFVRSHQNDESDSEQQQQRHDTDKKKDRVLDGEDVSRGQLSGIIRMADCARVIQRLADIGKEKKEKKIDPKTEAAQAAVQAAIQAQKASMQRPKPQVQKQPTAEEDDINRIKRQNKNGPATPAAAATPSGSGGTAHSSGSTADAERPTSDRVAALKRNSTAAQQSSEESDSSNAAASTTVRNNRNTTQTAESKPATTAAAKKAVRAGSSDSSASTESSSSATASAAASAAAPSSSANTTAASNRYSTARDSPARTRPTASAAAATTTTPATEKKPFVSRFLPAHSTAAAQSSAADKKDDSESSTEEETSSEESDDEVDSKPKTSTAASSSASTARPSTAAAAPSSASSTSSYRDRLESRRASRDEPSSRTSGYGSSSNPTTASSSASSYTPRSRPVPAAHHTDDDRSYGGSSSSYTSRFLNKSKSSAIISQPSLSTPNTSIDEEVNGSGVDDSDSRYGSGRSRYLAMKERRNRLARSRSSHQFGNDDEDPLDEPVSPTTASPSAYLASRYSGYGGTSSSDLARSRSSHALKSRDNSPIADRSTRNGLSGSTASGSGAAGSDKDGEALSSWARYLKNKYGNKSSSAKDTPTSSSSALSREPLGSSSHGTAASSRSTASDVSRRLSLGLPLRQANEIGSSDDDGSKNGLGSPTSPTVAVGITGAGTSPKQIYLRKRQQLFQLGGRGSEPGSFTWPRGLAVGPDNSIVVADSSNHRVQVFDSNGIFVKEFGEYGNGEGEFDCLAGVAVNRIGQYIIADRYNHRIQVLDPQGRFLRAFGSQGTADGKFNYPWGVTTDALGFIYVCDKENHRVQVFQSDGSFVGKFGSCGRDVGQLEHPHYIAVSNTNRVIVSDSNNHRVQIFDVNGKVLSTFGGEGSDDGQFKFPRGVAVDDQGYIFVADSGNNRIQIFNPDGSFLKTFGSWGSGDSEFKGLEGVAIMSNGNILVCDRENHRVQVF